VISQSKINGKQQELLDAALELFVAYGFHGTPTSKIAEKAGVANGTLFHYFKTKDELVIALYCDVKGKMSAYLVEKAGGETSLEGKFKSIFIHSVDWALQNRAAFMFIQQFHTSPFLSTISPVEIERQIKGHLLLIEEGIRAGLVRPLAPEYVYILITSQVFGLFQYLIAGDFPVEKQQQLTEETFEMMLHMLK